MIILKTYTWWKSYQSFMQLYVNHVFGVFLIFCVGDTLKMKFSVAEKSCQLSQICNWKCVWKKNKVVKNMAIFINKQIILEKIVWFFCLYAPPSFGWGYLVAIKNKNFKWLRGSNYSLINILDFRQKLSVNSFRSSSEESIFNKTQSFSF